MGTCGRGDKFMNKDEIQAIFIDRDGTIGGTAGVTYPCNFELFPFVRKSLSLLKQNNILILSFTNQPGISRGEAKVSDFEEELLLFGFDRVYLCPHEHGEGCSCRKPLPGMLIKAAYEYDLDLSKCVVIGDRWTDLVAASEVGAVKILVKTGGGEKDLAKFENGELFGKWAQILVDYIAKDLEDAISWLLE